MSTQQPFPLSGSLITGSELYEWLLESVQLVEGPILFCSAYIRSGAIEPLLSRLPLGVTGKVLVRWQFEDLIRGSSDLNLYELCKSHGLQLYMRQSFHGKVYVMPKVGIGVGSANATLSGFGMRLRANDEVCNLMPVSSPSLELIEGLFAGATLIDDALFALLEKACVAANTAGPVGDWPDEVVNYMASEPAPQRLLVDECFWSDGTWAVMAQLPTNEQECHDQFLLGIKPGASLAEVRRAVDRSPPIRWLRAQLGSVEPAELYFGNLSQRLHSALLDDPGPRRSEVKALLEQLLSWVKVTEMPQIMIDRPQHSQRVRLHEFPSPIVESTVTPVSPRLGKDDRAVQVNAELRSRRRTRY
jgi:hypothetical protein